jgi:hypothetical protein
LGDFFAALEKAEEERGGRAGYHKIKKGIALVGAKRVSPPRRAVFKNY